jgi:CubicO group peptidase (beta-lactamase class C family)
MSELMAGFPAPTSGQVTLANWRTHPYNRWGFQHVRELIPTADIPAAPDDLFRLPPAAADLGGLAIADGRGGHMSLEAFLEATATDAFVVVHRGRLVLERYRSGMTAATPHILMSVSKSMLGLLAGILAEKGVLDVDAEAARYVPEIADSAFRGASVRTLLDMRSGLDFDEDYLATSGPIIAYRKSTGWNPLAPGEAASDLRSFLPTLKASGAHGGRTNYVSPCTDLLGWIIERAAGRRYADLMSDLLWRPLGAAYSAYITVDRLGAPRAAGGMCMTATDLARVGQLLVQGGRRGDRSIVPEAWIADIETRGDAEAWDRGTLAGYFGGRSMHYRSKWYVEHGATPLLGCLGIHGQHLYVDRRAQIVVAKLSSQAMPLDAEAIGLTGRAIDALRQHLGG